MVYVEVVRMTSRGLAVAAGILAIAFLAGAPATAYAQDHAVAPTSTTAQTKSASAFTWLDSLLHGTDATSPPSPGEARPVRTVVAAARADGEPVSLTGHIRARTEQSLAFRIDGRMIARRVDVGQNVKPGELVAELDPQPKQDALRAAQAKHASAQAALHEAANNIERQRVLVAQGWSTRVMFDAAEKKFLAAKADVDSAAADLHAAEDQLGYTKLLADSPGAVTAKGAEAGEVVKAGQMIVTVALDDGADAVFDVPASLMRQVSPDAGDQHRADRRSQDPHGRTGAGTGTAGRPGDAQLPGQDRADRAAGSHAAGCDGHRAGAHGGAGRHRAAGDRSDHGGQQAGRLGGRSPESPGLAAAGPAAAPGLDRHCRDTRAQGRRNRGDRRRARLAARPEGSRCWGSAQ